MRLDAVSIQKLNTRENVVIENKDIVRSLALRNPCTVVETYRLSGVKLEDANGKIFFADENSNITKTD